MENNTKTQVEKLLSEMAEKHNYLEALESTMSATSDFSENCQKRLDTSKLYSYRVVPNNFLWNLARLELNLLFLHKTFLHDCEEEFEKEMREIVERVAFEEKISLEG